MKGWKDATLEVWRGCGEQMGSSMGSITARGLLPCVMRASKAGWQARPDPRPFVMLLSGVPPPTCLTSCLSCPVRSPRWRSSAAAPRDSSGSEVSAWKSAKYASGSNAGPSGSSCGQTTSRMLSKGMHRAGMHTMQRCRGQRRTVHASGSPHLSPQRLHLAACAEHSNGRPPHLFRRQATHYGRHDCTRAPLLLILIQPLRAHRVQEDPTPAGRGPRGVPVTFSLMHKNARLHHSNKGRPKESSLVRRKGCLTASCVASNNTLCPSLYMLQPSCLHICPVECTTVA